MRHCQLGVQEQKVRPSVIRPPPCWWMGKTGQATWGLYEHPRERNQTAACADPWTNFSWNRLHPSWPICFSRKKAERSRSHLGQESYRRLTSVVLDIVHSHVCRNKGSFAVFLFVLLLCQQLGLCLFSWDDVFNFCTRRKKKLIFINNNNKTMFKKGNRQRNYPKQKDLGVVIALLLYLICFLRKEAVL